MTEKAFEFDLVWALPEGTDEAAILDALFEAGCDDTAGISCVRRTEHVP